MVLKKYFMVHKIIFHHRLLTNAWDPDQIPSRYQPTLQLQSRSELSENFNSDPVPIQT